MTDHVEISTWVSFGLHEEIKHRARKLEIGVREYIRLLILDDLGFAATPGAPRYAEPVLPAVISATPRRAIPLPDPPREPESVLDLVARGYKPQQIAAMKRMSYRAVMAELGGDIDDEVEAQRRFCQ